MARPSFPLLAFLCGLQVLQQRVSSLNYGYKPYPKPYPPPAIYPPTTYPSKSWKPGLYPQKPFFPPSGIGYPTGPFRPAFPSGFMPYPGGFNGGKSWGSSGFQGKPFKQNKGLKSKLSALKSRLSPSCLFGSCADVSLMPMFIGYPQMMPFSGIGGGFGGKFPIPQGKSWRPPQVLPPVPQPPPPPPSNGRCPRGIPSGPTGPYCRQDNDCGFPRRCCLIRGLKSIDDVKPLCVMPVFA